MKRIGIILLILGALFCALYVGGFLVGVAVWLFKIMIGIIGIGVFVGGFYLGRWSKRQK